MQTAIPETSGALARVSRSRRTAGWLRVWARSKWLPCALFLAAVCYRIWLVAQGWPALDGDEGVTGLAGLHILTRGELPIFFWGQSYMGALQSYLAAAVFVVFGTSPFTLHLAVLLLGLGFIAAMYAVARAAYGRDVGLLVLLWLALGPPMALMREQTASSGYQDVLCLGAIALFSTWLRLRERKRLPHDRRAWALCLLTYGGIGLTLGIGIWSDVLILPVVLVAVGALVLQRWGEFLRGGGAALLIGLGVGAAPFLAYNLRYNGASFKQTLAIGTGAAGRAHTPLLPALGQQLHATLTVALPVLAGSPRACTHTGVVWYSYPPILSTAVSHATPLCDGANLLFSLALLAVYIVAAWQIATPLVRALRARWLRWGVMGAATDRAAAFVRTDRIEQPELARLWLRGMLIVLGGMYLAAYAASDQAAQYQFTSSRYLLPVYLAMPVLFGTLWQLAQPLLRWARQSRRPSGTSTRLGSAALAAAALVLLLAFDVYGSAETVAYVRTPDLFGLPARRVDTSLTSFLSAHAIDTFYSDYWVCFRLTFETEERLHCAVRGQSGKPTLALMNNRYPPYIATVAAAPHPAYIVPAGTAEDRQLPALAAHQGLPHRGYTRALVAGYAIYYYPQSR